MSSTELLTKSCSSIADHYHGDNMIGPFSKFMSAPYSTSCTSLTLQILEFSFVEERLNVEYALVYANTLLSQSRGNNHRVAKPALNAQH